jgi:Ca2+-binding RTX toxin-like protein
MPTIEGTFENDTLNGTAESDRIYGYQLGFPLLTPDGDDVLNGLGGNDFLFGGTGIDTLNGGDGDDTLQAGPNVTYLGGTSTIAPSDFVNGGNGNDTLILRYAGLTRQGSATEVQVRVEFVAGSAQVFLDGNYYGENATSIERLDITTGSRDDVITATIGDDVIFAGLGADVIRSGAGADRITDQGNFFDIDGGTGVDSLSFSFNFGAAAATFSAVTGLVTVGGVSGGSIRNVERFFVSGTGFADDFTGNAFDGSYGGGMGDDIIRGGSGSETINGGDGADRLFGNDGNDIIAGVNGNDIITGGGGEDSLSDGAGVDTVSGGAGNDIVSISGLEAGDSYAGDADFDTLQFNFFGTTTTDFSVATITGFETFKTSNYALGFEHVALMRGAQFLQFSRIDFSDQSQSKISFRMADAGALNLAGKTLAFNKLYLNDAGQSVSLIGALGPTGGVFLGALLPEVVGGAGADTINGLNIAGKSFRASGGGGADTMIARGSVVEFDGGSGNDTLTGNAALAGDVASFASALAGVSVNLGLTTRQDTKGAGLDLLTGFEGLKGSNFNDLLIGTAGANSLDGGAGSDWLAGLAGADAYFGGDGEDTVDYSLSNAGVFVEINNTGSGQFVAAVGGHAAGDTAFSIERLIGSSFADTLKGGFRSNVLNGGAGADNIYGGLGSDILTGGAGVDRFFFDTALNATTNRDTIVDFNVADDFLILQNNGVGLFTALSAGFLSAAAFASNATGIATSAAHRILYNTTNGDLSYDADGSGAAFEAIRFVRLFNKPALTAGDIFVN